VVLARKTALGSKPIEPPHGEGPIPIPPRVRALVDALDEYVKMAQPSDPDVVDMSFLAANALSRWRQPDAIERLEALLRDHRNAPSAEYAANILSDALIRSERIVEVDRLGRRASRRRCVPRWQARAAADARTCAR